jgi:hypothetical protein
MAATQLIVVKRLLKINQASSPELKGLNTPFLDIQVPATQYFLIQLHTLGFQLLIPFSTLSSPCDNSRAIVVKVSSRKVLSYTEVGLR